MADLYSNYRGLKGTPGQGFFGAGHVYWRYDANGDPKVVSVPLPTPTQRPDGTWVQSEFPDPPDDLKATNYRKAKKGEFGGGVYPTPEPRASYTNPETGLSDGKTVYVAGWLPNKRWVELDGTIWRTETWEKPDTAGGKQAPEDLESAIANEALEFAALITKMVSGK